MDTITWLQIGLGVIFVILIYDSFRPVKNLEHLSEADFKERMKKPKEFALIDVRNPYEYQTNHIKGAINLPLSKIKRNKVEIPTDKDIIIYCQTGIRSKQAAKVLRRRYRDLPLSHLKGGLYSLKTQATPGQKKK
ncbi:rhodanese-like domain-containing protein [Fredinandcohnia sp. QZ13]|uniref:rhodanese-like domain-containing protein n=1 Tax=Fredinandcohnia sp. QZ13 TaxID=3073144 RepID=UPI002853677A|nr:rhodanese-like domain-containing protein [Fredinandcohnia sp. QZ13]MDR4888271.1 rhodanese-like domain-containing protein [Fredinandcohnia sp. QZ13]